MAKRNKKHLVTQWRWEFLRRNPRYIKFYDKHSKSNEKEDLQYTQMLHSFGISKLVDYKTKKLSSEVEIVGYADSPSAAQIGTINKRNLNYNQGVENNRLYEAFMLDKSTLDISADDKKAFPDLENYAAVSHIRAFEVTINSYSSLARIQEDIKKCYLQIQKENVSSLPKKMKTKLARDYSVDNLKKYIEIYDLRMRFDTNVRVAEELMRKSKSTMSKREHEDRAYKGWLNALCLIHGGYKKLALK